MLSYRQSLRVYNLFGHALPQTTVSTAGVRTPRRHKNSVQRVLSSNAVASQELTDWIAQSNIYTENLSFAAFDGRLLLNVTPFLRTLLCAGRELSVSAAEN